MKDMETTDSSERVPAVLGKRMLVKTTGETCCTVSFGSLQVGLAYVGERGYYDLGSGGVVWWVGQQRGASHHNDGVASSIAEAVADIELGLLKIHDAIREALRAVGEPP